jgi:hypothetical protein
MSRNTDMRDGRNVIIDRTAHVAFTQGREVTMELVLEVEQTLTSASLHDARLYLHDGNFPPYQRPHALSPVQEGRLLGEIRSVVEKQVAQFEGWKMPLPRQVHVPMNTLRTLLGVEGRDFRTFSHWLHEHQNEVAQAIEARLPEILDSIVRTEQFQEALRREQEVTA